METATRTAPPVTPALQGRPLSVGGVIGRSFSVWFGNLVPFSVVTLVVYAPAFLIAAVSSADVGPSTRILLNVVTGFADLVAAGSLTFGVLQSLQGTRVPLSTLLETGFAKLARVFAASFFVGLVVLLGFILLVVPGLIALCGYYVAVPAVVVEQELAASDALNRSASLTWGSRWSILAIRLIVFLVTMTAVAVGVAVLSLAVPALPHPLPLLLATAVGALVSPLGACAAAVAYHDLRVAREGVDTAALVKVFE